MVRLMSVLIACWAVVLSGCTTTPKQALEGVAPSETKTEVRPVTCEVSGWERNLGLDRILLCWYRHDYVRTHPGLEPKTRSAILDGRIFLGMSTNEVAASWGRPAKINDYGNTEKWVYGYHDWSYNFVWAHNLYMKNHELIVIESDVKRGYSVRY